MQNRQEKDMQDGKASWARMAIGAGLLIALALAVPMPAQPPASPHPNPFFPPPPLFMSGIFRASVPGVKTKTALWVPDTEFFEAKTGTIATMGKDGYTLTDVDIDTSTGQRYYSAIFKSGVSSTQYWELPPGVFTAKVGALAEQKIYLISLHIYFSPQNGDLLYSGIFQPGKGPQMFSDAALPMDSTKFQNYLETNAEQGYFLTSMVAYPVNGEDVYVGVLRGGLEQGFGQYNFYTGDWNSMANHIFVNAANGLRLVALNNDGQGNYIGAWIAGTDPFEVVAATTVDVFNKKTSELHTAGLSPVRILIEKSYEPPIGLAMAFHNLLDGTPAGGYSYSVSEKDSLTAMGGVGLARALWDPAPAPMAEDTRLDIASVTKWIAGVALYKALESHPSVKLDTPIMDVLGTGLLLGHIAGKYVDKVKISNLLNMDSGIYEGQCGVSPAPGYYSESAWLACALSSCTRPYPYSAAASTPPIDCQPPGPKIPSAYSDADFQVLRAVIERITGQSFESYVSTFLFVPLGINNPDYADTDIRNANCHPDLVTPTLPLYYAANQTSGPGFYDQEYNTSTGLLIPPLLSTERSVAVCGNGGMQMTAAQAGKFWNGLMHEKLINHDDLTSLLNDWVINTSEAVTWSGQGYAKDGGYPIHNGQGPTSDVVAVPATDTQVAVFANMEGNTPSGVAINPQGAIVDGLDWMGFHPVDTVSVVNQNSAAFGPMCFNVSGGGAAQGTAIIQWTCGPKPLPANELFTKVDSVSGNGTFMLQVPQTLWTTTPMCVTSEYDNESAGDEMILYACNGLSNQMFKLGKPNSKGFSSIIVQVSKQCLTVDEDSISSGANIVQEPCVSGESSQEWSIESATAQ